MLFDGLRLHAPRPSAWLTSASDLRSGALRVSGDGHGRSHGQRDGRTGKRSGQRGENGRGCHLRCQRRIPALDVSWRRDATNGDGNRGSLSVRFRDAGRSVSGDRSPRCGSNWAGGPCVECGGKSVVAELRADARVLHGVFEGVGVDSGRVEDVWRREGQSATARLRRQADRIDTGSAI